MKSISNFIFNLSSKKLAILVVILPVILMILYTTLSVIYQNIETSGNTIQNFISTLTITTNYLFLIPVLIITIWLKEAVLSVDQKDLGIPLKWFRIAYLFFLFYIIFNIGLSYVPLIKEDLRYVFYALSEWVNSVGLLISYPVICHYAARAIYIKKANDTPTITKTIGYTLLLIFMPVSIPFAHHYFSSIRSENRQLVLIYLIALGILTLLAILFFVLAIIGLV
ncbi:hypothetical protein JBL43_15815 [Aureibaculum sp. A20]|uniref:Uncharacterized protein n=1 Tax=Aureibaculum flavum TaxID=2795986 RepID=A0ABS0WUT5_9FLAO|nr:hypothetical protein [Aureibaculum flavum]MBJ2175720.1 hypothetical protein [Aureibaculum flavum]